MIVIITVLSLIIILVIIILIIIIAVIVFLFLFLSYFIPTMYISIVALGVVGDAEDATMIDIFTVFILNIFGLTILIISYEAALETQTMLR